MIADYLADTRNVLARLDRTQITTMVGYLSRLRDRHGRLYLVNAPLRVYPLSLLAGAQFGEATRCDTVVYFSPHDAALLTDPITLTICGASDGDLARRASACVVIPSFSASIVQALQAVVWRGIVEEIDGG